MPPRQLNRRLLAMAQVRRCRRRRCSAFDNPLRLADAVSLAQRQSETTLAYRYENPHVVGELSANADYSVGEFLKLFNEKFGTEPQVVGLVVERQRPANQPTAPQDVYTIATGLDKFAAPPIPTEKLDAISKSGNRTDVYSAADSTSSLLASEWRPNNIYSWTMRSGTHQYFSQTAEWHVGASSPGNLDTAYGMEFGIELWNDATGVRNNLPPLCGPDYRDQFIAKNYSWNNWWVTSMTSTLIHVNAYADYNDYGDECGRNSMAIGLGTPQSSAFTDPSVNAIDFWIDAPIGVTGSSEISGGVQTIDNGWCVFNGSMSLTDCMGLGQQTAGSRASLNVSRGWIAAPDRCWVSTAYGTVPPTLC